MMRVYFVSGLAADRRVFKHIRLPEGYEIVHLDWIPALKNESLESYSNRLSERIISDEPFALVGLSMGGMIVSEIAKQFRERSSGKPVITILLSSVPVASHLPTHFKFARYLKLHKMVPVRFLKSASLIKRFFSPDTDEDKKILTQVVQDSDPVFIRWAMGAVLGWKNNVIPDPVLHIHGTKDAILPARYTTPTHFIHSGSHLMVMGRAKELNDLIAKALLPIKK